MLRAGIDIGGTSAKLGLVARDGTLVSRFQVPTGRDLEADALVERLAAALRGLPGSAGAGGLGAAAPGMRRADGEGVINVTNLPQLDGYPLRSSLERATGLPTHLDNDANAAALGEHRFGAGRGADRLLVITVGTGIGGGMVVDGAVHRVACQGLGDPGHVIVAQDGPRCGCGARGCVEALASVPAIVARANALSGASWAAPGEVAAAARAGHAGAARALVEAGRLLGMALATLVHLLAPDRILLGGGGLEAAEELLFEPARESLMACGQPFLLRRLTVGRAALGNDAGIIGAAALVGD